MSLTIYHNPRCSKSRATLELIRDSGVEPRIVLYLEETPDAGTLLGLARMLGQPLSALLRRNESDYRDAADAGRVPEDDGALAEWLARHPKVLQRPVVVDEARGRAVIGRPPENVRTLLGKRR